MQIMISDIPVVVYKKRIKYMHLYVKPPNGKVTVSAPLDISDDVIERFVRTKSSWVKNQVKKFDAQPRLAVCCASRIKSQKIAYKAIFFPANCPRMPDNRDFCDAGGAKIHKCNRLRGHSRKNLLFHTQKSLR
jgi:predicted metal-dependent hydrolase